MSYIGYKISNIAYQIYTNLDISVLHNIDILYTVTDIYLNKIFLLKMVSLIYFIVSEINILIKFR